MAEQLGAAARRADAPPDVAFDGVRIERGGQVILDNISCVLPKGSVTAILGPSGAGKSTLLHAITGELPLARGHIDVLGAPLPRSRAGLLGLDLEALGIPSQEEAVERYVARTGYPVPPMDWYFAYNLFRLAGIMQGIKKRVIDGTASSAHARQMSERVTPLIERAHDFAVAAGMA